MRFLLDRTEFIISILNPYGLIAAIVVTSVGIGLDIYTKTRPLIPLYFISFFFFALFVAFTIGYMIHQIPNNIDPFSTTLVTFGLIALPNSFFLSIGGLSGKGFHLDLFTGVFSLIFLPLATALVTHFFVRIQSSLWTGILWN